MDLWLSFLMTSCMPSFTLTGSTNPCVQRGADPPQGRKVSRRSGTEIMTLKQAKQAARHRKTCRTLLTMQIGLKIREIMDFWGLFHPQPVWRSKAELSPPWAGRGTMFMSVMNQPWKEILLCFADLYYICMREKCRMKNYSSWYTTK